MIVACIMMIMLLFAGGCNRQLCLHFAVPKSEITAAHASGHSFLSVFFLHTRAHVVLEIQHNCDFSMTAAHLQLLYGEDECVRIYPSPIAR
jgi:hypothetical protein